MELSCSKIKNYCILKKTHSKNISYIFSKEKFSYISGNETLHFSAQAQRIKKFDWGKFFMLQEMETLELKLSYIL